MREKLLIINREQFGTLTDSYKWCQHLRDKYDITFLCFDANKDKRNLDGINVKYISYKGSRIIRALRFLIVCWLQILRTDSKVIVIYFEYCHLLKLLLPNKKMHLDIRTLAVFGSEMDRTKFNMGIKSSSKYFDTVSVLDEYMIDVLGLRENNSYVLPLGADVISETPKKYDKITLLYVGTLNGRNIAQTIWGLSDFISKNKSADITYDIVGNGQEFPLLEKLVEELNLSEIVTLHGRVPYDELKPFFDKCNVGVSFVPITDYYDNQPPTKIYEYALAGLYQIATMTNANMKLINESNGILIRDNSDDFSMALSKIYSQKSAIDEKTIRNSLKHSTWKRIVEEDLNAILDKLQ